MLDALAAEEVRQRLSERGQRVGPNACETQWMQTQNSNAPPSSFLGQREYIQSESNIDYGYKSNIDCIKQK